MKTSHGPATTEYILSFRLSPLVQARQTVREVKNQATPGNEERGHTTHPFDKCFQSCRRLAGPARISTPGDFQHDAAPRQPQQRPQSTDWAFRE